jgi:hypothetical protein
MCRYELVGEPGVLQSLVMETIARSFRTTNREEHCYMADEWIKQLPAVQ